MTGKHIESKYHESGYTWSQTSNDLGQGFTLVNDLGLGQGRRGVEGEVVSEKDGRVEVELSFYDENTSSGGEWHKTVVGTLDEIISICGRAIEDGERPPKELIKAA